MAIEIKLTERHLPISPIFIDFLYRLLFGDKRGAGWHDQTHERLSDEASEILKTARAHSGEVMQNPVAQQAISRSYDLMMSLMFGAMDRLQAYHDKHRFITVVGCPRSGGSYLTKHLFNTLGHTVEKVPSVIGHDGFPDPEPFTLSPGRNGYITLIRHMAEYMAMAELYFSKTPPVDGKIIIPKKATKAAYHGAFFNTCIGAESEVIVTLRHPLPSCISTYQKSGGLPGNKKLAVRSNIEQWVRRDIEFLTGRPPANGADYFDCYLKYWENYHCAMVNSGLLANRNLTIAPFKQAPLMDVASGFYKRFGHTGQPDEFRTRQNPSPDPAWADKADAAVERIATVWGNLGHAFPAEIIMERW